MAKKVLITLHQDEDGMYIAEYPSLPGCISQGETEEAAHRNIEAAVRECMAVRTEQA